MLKLQTFVLLKVLILGVSIDSKEIGNYFHNDYTRDEKMLFTSLYF